MIAISVLSTPPHKIPARKTDSERAGLRALAARMSKADDYA